MRLDCEGDIVSGFQKNRTFAAKNIITMAKKLITLMLLVFTAVLAQAQVGKMIGEWNTYDDKTGDLRSTIRITENKGAYQAVIIAVYEKDANGKFYELKPPYPKDYEGVVGTQIFKEMKVDGEHLKGKIYDPESQKTYNGKVTYKAKHDELSVRGSLDRAGILGRSQIWKRK